MYKLFSQYSEEVEDTGVFAVYSERGPGAEPWVQWTGLPSLDELVEGVGNRSVEGIVLEVELGSPLPPHCVNIYCADDIQGSYDGHAVRISLWERFHSMSEGGEKLRNKCQAVIDLFFSIVHGHVEGEWALSNQPGHYGAMVDRAAAVRQVGAAALAAAD